MKSGNLLEPSLVIIFFLFLFGFFNTESIYAHNAIKVGNYTIEAGWESSAGFFAPSEGSTLIITVSAFCFDNPYRDLEPSFFYFYKEIKYSYLIKLNVSSKS